MKLSVIQQEGQYEGGESNKFITSCNWNNHLHLTFTGNLGGGGGGRHGAAMDFPEMLSCQFLITITFSGTGNTCSVNSNHNIIVLLHFIFGQKC